MYPFSGFDIELTAGAELCEECRAVWGASWRAASYRRDERGGRPSEESAVCIATE
jgi:hypothetical protein